MIILFQALVVIISLVAISSVIAKKKDGLLGPKGALFWTTFWIAMSAVVIWPNSVQVIADYVGIGRGVDVVIYSALVVLFFLVFKMNLKIEGLKRDLTDVVRGKALKK